MEMLAVAQAQWKVAVAVAALRAPTEPVEPGAMAKVNSPMPVVAAAVVTVVAIPAPMLPTPPPGEPVDTIIWVPAVVARPVAVALMVAVVPVDTTEAHKGEVAVWDKTSPPLLAVAAVAVAVALEATVAARVAAMAAVAVAPDAPGPWAPAALEPKGSV